MSDGLERRFEGRAVLEKLLAASGTLADVDDVAQAFTQALADGVPAAVVIQALWEDEPRFESPAQAQALFANLLGLYDLLAEGQAVDLAAPARKERPPKREKAPAPEPFTGAPDDAFVEAAWRHLDDFPKVRERLAHGFDNKQDALVSWLDASGLGDEAFAVARHLLGEVYAMLELGGHPAAQVDEAHLPAEAGEALPAALAAWLDEGVQEARDDEAAPLGEAEAAKVLDLVRRGAAALWARRTP